MGAWQIIMALVVVFFGVGNHTGDWMLGAAASCACWVLIPYQPATREQEEP
jgi:hypothetical protein